MISENRKNVMPTRGPYLCMGLFSMFLFWERGAPAWGHIFPMVIAGGLAEP
jgi:hypothetical protein